MDSDFLGGGIPIGRITCWQANRSAQTHLVLLSIPPDLCRGSGVEKLEARGMCPRDAGSAERSLKKKKGFLLCGWPAVLLTGELCVLWL